MINEMCLTLQCATANPDGRKRALLVGGNIANLTDVGATFDGIIRALKEKVYIYIETTIHINTTKNSIIPFVFLLLTHTNVIFPA